MLVESCCLAFYTFRLVQAASFSRAEVFWKDAKNLVVMVVVGATIVDMVIFAAMAGSGFGMLALRCTRPLRPLLMVNFAENKQVGATSYVILFLHLGGSAFRLRCLLISLPAYFSLM